VSSPTDETADSGGSLRDALKQIRPEDSAGENRAFAQAWDNIVGSPRKPITLSRYVLLDRVAAGGAGVVYRAYDPELDRKVAIKLLRTDSSGAGDTLERRARLIREAQAMAQLNHPNVIAVYDVGAYGKDNLAGDLASPELPPDGVFVVMELVDGVTLAEWFQQEQRAWRAVVDKLMAAGRGLAAAHEHGLIHRDFKPANVIVGEDGRVRVLDFGLARVLDEPQSVPRAGLRDESVAARDDETVELPPEHVQVSTSGPSAGLHTPLTQTGTLMGTPTYMSPEQHAALPTDTRTDQFSFCVTLYEGLYGTRPFAGRSMKELGESKAAGRIAKPPPSADVQPQLHELVLRGLRPDPADRFSSMDDVLAQLGDISKIDPGRRRRRWLMLGVGVLVAGGAVLGLEALVEQRARVCALTGDELAGVWDPTSKARIEQNFSAGGESLAPTWHNVEAAIDKYTARWLELRQEACTESLVEGRYQADVMADRFECLDRRLQRLAGLTRLLQAAQPRVLRRSLESVSALPSAGDCLAPPGDARSPGRSSPQALAAALDVEARIGRAGMLVRSGDFNQGVEEARVAVDDARATGRATLIGPALVALGSAQRVAGQLEQAQASVDEALGVAETAEDPVVGLRALILGVSVMGARGQYEEADRMGRLAQARVSRLEPGGALEASLAYNLGVLRYDEARFPEALAFLERALEIRLEIFGPQHHLVGAVHNTIGNVHQQTSQPQLAREYYARALAIWTGAYGEQHPHVAYALTNTANVLKDLGEYDAAVEHYSRAFEIMSAVNDADHPDLANIRYNLCVMRWHIGDWPEAEQDCRRAIEVWEARLAKDHPTTASAYNVLGILLQDQGRFDAALEALKTAHDMQQRSLAPDHVELRQSQQNLAVLYAKRGELDLAFSMLAQSEQRNDSSDQLRVKVDVGQLEASGQVLLEAGRADEAIVALSEAVGIRAQDYGSAHVFTARTRSNLGFALLAAGRETEASEALGIALRDLEADLGPDYPRLARIRAALAQVSATTDADGAAPP
jgi:serine/threonine protein kinase/tetratricopeptide (TPR) repeat protein